MARFQSWWWWLLPSPLNEGGVINIPFSPSFLLQWKSWWDQKTQLSPSCFPIYQCQYVFPLSLPFPLISSFHECQKMSFQRYRSLMLVGWNQCMFLLVSLLRSAISCQNHPIKNFINIPCMICMSWSSLGFSEVSNRYEVSGHDSWAATFSVLFHLVLTAAACVLSCFKRSSNYFYFSLCMQMFGLPSYYASWIKNNCYLIWWLSLSFQTHFNLLFSRSNNTMKDLILIVASNSLNQAFQ